MFVDDNGFKYSNDLTKLISCPKIFSGDFVIPNTVTTINPGAFEGCTSLTSIKIPNSVTEIQRVTFKDCTGLTTITIPNSVTKIGDYAFKGCTGLTTITIPNSVKTIGEWAFSSCSGLTSVTIPNSVTKIEDGTFHGCSGLISVTIGNSVTTIGRYAFADCNGLTKTNYTGTIADWCKIHFALPNDDCYYNPIEYSHNFFINDVEVKDLIIPEGVESISDAAFCGCSSLTSVTIPNSVTTIGEEAFAYCRGLISITIPNSVIWIGREAFCGCNGLTKTNYTGTIADWCKIHFALPNDNRYSNPIEYSHNFFINDVEVKDLIIPEGVESISGAAFRGCSSLISVIIPNSVTKIGDSAFAGCNGLTSITIPNSVTTIRDGAFGSCKGLTSITIPNSVTKIGEQAFSGCSSLISITIPNSVTTIGWAAFAGCSGLTSITIPNSVTTIERDAFHQVNNIVNNGSAIGSPWRAKCVNGYVDGYLVYSDASKTILCGCSSVAIGEIVIPNSVTTIEDDAFVDCDNLTEIVVPLGQKERFAQMDGLKKLREKIIERAPKIDGYSQILFNLAKAYEMGVGVKQDEEQAYMFYKQAAEAGSQEAQQWIQRKEGSCK